MGNYKNSTSKGKTNSENSKFDKMQSKLKPAPQASLEKAMIEEESLNQTAEAEEIKMTEPLEVRFPVCSSDVMTTYIFVSHEILNVRLETSVK